MPRRLHAGHPHTTTPNRKNTMTTTITCPHCSHAVPIPVGALQWDGRCECGRSVFEAIQPEDQAPAPKLYTTTRDYITEVINPALEDHLNDYDVDGIAETMLVRHNVTDPATGYINENRSGFVERQDIWFWDVVAAHELDGDDGQEVVGDVYATGNGIEVVTPDGRWILTEEQALKLNAALGSMLAFVLTQPWSVDDPSTILSRGRRPVAEEG